jgi:hypothetical protein
MLSKRFTQMLAGTIIVVSTAALSPLATAASSVFQSHGIKATITSISLLDKKIVLQFSIQNARPDPIYLTLISGLGGSTGTLMATNGSVYEMEFGHISGMSFCNDSTTATTDQEVQACLKRSDEANMTAIDPDQSSILGILYDLQGGSKASTEADKINFALKFLVRSATGNKTGPPSIITISFPLVPLASQ